MGSETINANKSVSNFSRKVANEELCRKKNCFQRNPINEATERKLQLFDHIRRMNNGRKICRQFVVLRTEITK